MQDFKIGDKAVYPAHGVGVIKNIESKKIGDQNLDFYILQILSSGATLMVPTSGYSKAGMRTLISNKEVNDVYKILRSQGNAAKTTWNRRYREFNDKLHTGDIIDIAEVLRDLSYLKEDKDLSYGEKKMMEKALGMLSSELSEVAGKDSQIIEKELTDILFPEVEITEQ